jgi:RNA polymerase-binding transcription factor DksA
VDPEVMLADDRDRTQARLAGLRFEFDEIVAARESTNADDEHDPEGATIAYERAQVDALIRQAVRHLEEIDAALERVRAGTYGLCSVCGRPIPDGRLEARPTTRTCVEHAN